MMKKPLLQFLVLGIILSQRICAQVYVDSTSLGKVIQSIQIQGNKVTKDAIIIRELKQNAGDSLNWQKTIEDWKRIQNLNLFHRVIVRDVIDDQKLHLVFEVSEMIYWVLYPIFYINDRNWNKYSYGAGILHNNYRGRSEALKFDAILGYDPSATLEYVNPWIGGNHQYFWGFQVFYRKERNKHYTDNINEKYGGFTASFGKRWGYHLVSQCTFGYEVLQFSQYIPGQTLSGNKEDHLPSLSLLAAWDHRDLKEYPNAGWYFKIYGIKKGIPGFDVDYGYYGTDIRKYFPIHQSAIAVKAAGVLSAGQVPFYNRVYLGYSTRIRGYFFDQFEGENRALASVAFRVPLLPIRYINLFENTYLRNLKFGINLGFFADTGMIWFQKGGPRKAQIISGYGAGLHFRLPYIDVLRLETAFDEQGNIQYIIDVGVDI